MVGVVGAVGVRAAVFVEILLDAFLMGGIAHGYLFVDFWRARLVALPVDAAAAGPGHVPAVIVLRCHLEVLGAVFETD